MKPPRSSSTGRRTASTSLACWARRAAAETRDARPRRPLDRSARCGPCRVVARAGLERARAGRAGLAAGAAPRHAPGLDGRWSVVRVRHLSNKDRLRVTPVNRDSGSASLPGGASKKSRENRPGSAICTGRRAAKCSVWCAVGSNRAPSQWRRQRRPRARPRRFTSGTAPAGFPARSITGRCAGSPAGAPPEITSPTWCPPTCSGRRARSGRSCWSPTPWLVTPS